MLHFFSNHIYFTVTRGVFDIDINLIDESVNISSEKFLWRLQDIDEYTQKEKTRTNIARNMLDYAEHKITRKEYVDNICSGRGLKSWLITYLKAKKHLKNGDLEIAQDKVNKSDNRLRKHAHDFETEKKMLAASEEDFDLIIENLSKTFPKYKLKVSEEIPFNIKIKENDMNIIER